MKLLFKQCLECKLGLICYEKGFKQCPKIEAAGQGLGVPVKLEDNSFTKNVPFSVYMTLKHLVKPSRMKMRSPQITSRR